MDKTKPNESCQDILEAASCDLAGVRGMLLVLADYVEGEAADAVYGIEALLSVAKAKVDAAARSVPK